MKAFTTMATINSSRLCLLLLFLVLCSSRSRGGKDDANAGKKVTSLPTDDSIHQSLVNNEESKEESTIYTLQDADGVPYDLEIPEHILKLQESNMQAFSAALVKLMEESNQKRHPRKKNSNAAYADASNIDDPQQVHPYERLALTFIYKSTKKHCYICVICIGNNVADGDGSLYMARRDVSPGELFPQEREQC